MPPLPDGRGGLKDAVSAVAISRIAAGLAPAAGGAGTVKKKASSL
jgi:hypothetical protein